ncbi:hypothetical protein ABPG74_007328 [Tetrahymena malaccensis]
MVKGEQITLIQTKNTNQSPQPLCKAIKKCYQETEKQNTQQQHDQKRKPLQDITNTIQHQNDFKVKSEKVQTETKLTNKYAYLTFLNRTAEKKYRTLLFVDRELNFPQEYQKKLQNHISDNDADSDDDQIFSAINQLKQSLILETDKQKKEIIINSDLQSEI